MPTTETLLRLLVATWVADGKSRSQVHALLMTAEVDAATSSRALASFDELAATVTEPSRLREVRRRAGCSVFDARRALRSSLGDVDLAVEIGAETERRYRDEDPGE